MFFMYIGVTLNINPSLYLSVKNEKLVPFRGLSTFTSRYIEDLT